MERFVKGDVVAVPFPFSDLSAAKRRPALIVSVLEGRDIILCQITSKKKKDEYAMVLEKSDFALGSLPVSSFIRPNKLFTAEDSIIIYKVGSLAADKISEVAERICQIVRS